MQFTTQPANVIIGAIMSPVVVNTGDGSSSDIVTISLANLPPYHPENHPQAQSITILSGTLSVTAVAGVATFSNLAFHVCGNYILLAQITTPQATVGTQPYFASNSFGVFTGQAALLAWQSGTSYDGYNLP